MFLKTSGSELSSKRRVSLIKCVIVFVCLLILSFDSKLLSNKKKTGNSEMMDFREDEFANSRLSLLMFAEAGKKKKEKSEVVVISVNNPAKASHGGGGYPIFIPTCGGGGGHSGGYGGYGRRKRSL